MAWNKAECPVIDFKIRTDLLQEVSFFFCTSLGSYDFGLC